jgi:hypothetical protein
MPNPTPNIFSTTNAGTQNATGTYRYDPDSYNTLYHESDHDLLKQENGTLDISLNQYYILDNSGNPKLISKTMTQGNSTYYVPGTYLYSKSNYVPTYEESVFLSKSSNQPTYEILQNTADMQGGFCKEYENHPVEKEKKCNTMDLNQCASTQCCVLLGGSKCVAGNENGPLLKASYSDTFIQDPTYYFFEGKCYGNCAAGV